MTDDRHHEFYDGTPESVPDSMKAKPWPLTPLKRSERLRLKRMARHVADCKSVMDLGYAEMPNPFLPPGKTVGIDMVLRPPTWNYRIVRQGNVMTFSNYWGQFDGIVAGEVIEHLADPLGFLDECMKALTPGGRLVLSTPNPNSLIERLLTLWLSRRFFYAEDHIMLFPQRWLVRMLERAGFKDIRLYSGGHPTFISGLMPFPRPWCYQTIAVAHKPALEDRDE